MLVRASCKKVAGVDEAGRGPLAGPVVAAAVILPNGYCNSEITDSKKLTAKKREKLVEVIRRDALDIAVVAVGHRRIDALNIREATRLAMRLCLARVQADYALLDGDMTIDSPVPHEAIVKGDSLFVQIAAASIIAKVHRDQLMCVLDAKYPGFELSGHAGYPTARHRDAIARLGPSPIHRRTFRGVKEYYGTGFYQSPPVCAAAPAR